MSLIEIFYLKKIKIDEKFPKFIIENKEKYKNWIQE